MKGCLKTNRQHYFRISNKLSRRRETARCSVSIENVL